MDLQSINNGRHHALLNMTDIVLTAEEVHAVTGRARHKDQSLVLLEMGIPFRNRPDGRPMVSRDVFQQVMGAVTKKDIDKQQPDFDDL